MDHPIYIESTKMPSRKVQGYRVWVTPRRPPRAGSVHKHWVQDLSPEPHVFKLFRGGHMTRPEFEAYYRARLETASAQDNIRSLACLSRRYALILMCDCPDTGTCYLPILSRAIQECRERGDFRLSLIGLVGRKD